MTESATSPARPKSPVRPAAAPATAPAAATASASPTQTPLPKSPSPTKTLGDASAEPAHREPRERRPRHKRAPLTDAERIEQDTRRVFVGKLPFKVTVGEVRAHFAAAGAVDDVHLVKKATPERPQGFGFVLFKESKAVDVAVAQLNGSDLKGASLDVQRIDPERAARKAEARAKAIAEGHFQPRNHHQGNDADGGEFKSKRAARKPKTPRAHDNGEPHHHAAATTGHREGPATDIHTGGGSARRARKPRPAIAEGGESAAPREPRQPRPRGPSKKERLATDGIPRPKTLYVSNVDKSVDDAALRAYFEKAGYAVTSATITFTRSGLHRQFAFVELGSEKEVEDAIEKLAGAELAGKSIGLKRALMLPPREKTGAEGEQAAVAAEAHA
ncbi:RNA-binding protein 34 [Allomyces javanicus]|nr:RNA-binding protein 34 [Allomyces javanicus]